MGGISAPILPTALPTDKNQGLETFLGEEGVLVKSERFSGVLIESLEFLIKVAVSIFCKILDSLCASQKSPSTNLEFHI